MSSSMVSKNGPQPAGYGDGGEGSVEGEAAPVTSCLYLRPGAGALDRDAVLRRIRHRRRHNRLHDTLRSMVQAPAPASPPQPAEPDGVDGAERHLPWPIYDAFSAP
ncbi:uncharacterized protein [Miscanthus floridulus]|uniref:uncharacterized protein n=1 Tax=Miscanthus floridulus TaxID=154761 RepID=UPI00345836E0